MPIANSAKSSKTTELYIEQVLVGSLVIAVLLLPWLPELIQSVKSLETAGAIIGGSAWLGVSFMIGVPFDRLADTLTARMERFALLFTALRSRVGKPFPEARLDRTDKLVIDLFEADKHLTTALQSGIEAIVDRIDYHRARIRISRALAVFGPGLTVSATAGVWRYSVSPKTTMCFEPPWPCMSAESIPIWSLAIVFAAYLLWCWTAVTGSRLPRADDTSLRTLAKDLGWLSNNLVKKGETDWPFWKEEGLRLLPPLGAVFAGMIFAGATGKSSVFLVAVTGAVLSVLSFWSCWRVSETYFAFVRDVFTATKKI